MISTKKIKYIASLFCKQAQLGSPNVRIQPGSAETTAALDILKLWDPNYFSNVEEIIVGPGANYGHVESGPGKDPHVIYINADRIVMESGGKQNGKEAALACAKVMAHERGHVMSYDENNGFVGGESPAEAEEQKFESWLNSGAMQRIENLPSYKKLS